MKKFLLLFACLFMFGCPSSTTMPADGEWEVAYSPVSPSSCGLGATHGLVTVANGKVVANADTPANCSLTESGNSYTFTCTEKVQRISLTLSTEDPEAEPKQEMVEEEFVQTETETFRVLDSGLITGVSEIKYLADDEVLCEMKYVTFWVRKGD